MTEPAFTLRWKESSWRGPKRPCARCHKKVRAGIVNPLFSLGPVLCYNCWYGGGFDDMMEAVPSERGTDETDTDGPGR